MKKKTLFAGLAIIIGLINPGFVLAQNFSSSNYKLKNFNFGQEIVVTSNDLVAPVIAGDGPTSSDVQSDQAKISWTTNKDSTSIVSFGTVSGTYTTDFGKGNEYVTSHEITLTGLSPETKYYYIVKSTDRLGNVGTSGEKNLTTTKKASISGVVISDITLDSAIAVFETNTVVNAELSYGTSSSYGSSLTEQSGSQTTKHTLKFSGLSQGATYHFQIKGTDAYGKKTYSDDYIFSTLPLPSITNPFVSENYANWMVLKWTTNTETDSLVEYWANSDVKIAGLKAGEKQSNGSSERTKNHQAKLINLVGSTSYSYLIHATDASGNTAATISGIFYTALDNTAPKISKLQADTASASEDKNGKVQMPVTWETDELSSSQVVYGKGRSEASADKNTTENATLTTTHRAIVTGLDPSTAYHLKAVSKDPAGNKGESESTTVLTPKKKRSLIQLIIDKLDETFGWMKKIKLFK